MEKSQSKEKGRRKIKAIELDKTTFLSNSIQKITFDLNFFTVSYILCPKHYHIVRGGLMRLLTRKNGSEDASFSIPNSTVIGIVLLLVMIFIFAHTISSFLINSMSGKSKEKAEIELKENNQKMNMLEKAFQNKNPQDRANSLKVLLDSKVIEDPNGELRNLANSPDLTPYWEPQPSGVQEWIEYLASDDTPRKARLTETYPESTFPITKTRDPEWEVINPDNTMPRVEWMYFRATDGSVRKVRIASVYTKKKDNQGRDVEYIDSEFVYANPDGSDEHREKAIWLLDPQRNPFRIVINRVWGVRARPSFFVG